MPDSSNIDAALVAKVSGDTGAGGVMTLMTDGVFMDEAPPDKTKFVIIALSSSADTHVQPGVRSIEEDTYLVKAVERNTSGATVKTAAARLDALLDNGTLSVTGYSLMCMKRTERIRYVEVDENTDLHWQHRGGLYEVTVST